MAIGDERRQARIAHIDRSIRHALDYWHSGERAELTAAPALASPAPTRPIGVTHPHYHAGGFRTSLRLIVWIGAALRFYAGMVLDKLTRRDTMSRRATRLRRIFERLGPTFIKIGQQLSVRADMLALEYCQELSLMLDSVPPFETTRAQAIIERAVNTPISRIFDEFHPAPIGSGSLACVYRARLLTGESVAVKVRRPGIAVRLAADMHALGWLLQLGEALGFFRSGYTQTLRNEFARMLFEEIDFLREARNTELFRLEAIRAKRSYVVAPRVHFALCSEDVLVVDFVTGIFLKDIVAALDRQDEEALQGIRDQGIDLHEVARRLVLTAHWELLESLLFHADPHQANICVQPGNVLVFIDFGSCGRLTDRYRRIWHRFYQELETRNVQGMVRAAVAILEPLPSIDVDGFSREIELIFWDWVNALESEHVAWWEKASGMLWMKFAAAARRHQAPMNSEIVRIFRATFIYDTTIFRLWDKLDMVNEFRRYQREAGKRAKRRVRRAFWRRVENGLTNTDYAKIEALSHMARQIVGRLQHFLDTPSPNFAREIGKLSYGVNLILRLSALGLAAYVGSVIITGGYSLIYGEPLKASSIVFDVTVNQWAQAGLAAIALVLIRKAIRKFSEPDAG